MAKEVTIQNLNKGFMNELFSSKMFWLGFVLYSIGTVLFALKLLWPMLCGIIMFVAASIMLGEDIKGQKKVLKRLSWKR